ncbi:HPP family protein [Halomarina rubra]|uniref:HPP family protein n=1 Tax=Halomarina rubra TaxID=2071873 RepID=A0ABD6AYQ6_9EURY|nr:HPP family protein [Halomarina rubra]
MDDRLGTSLHTGLLVTVVGAFAWASGLPALFPSLGPSAFVLAMFPESEASNPRRVLGSHIIGVVAGLAAYHMFGAGLVATQETVPFSLASARLVVSSVVAIVLTVVGMLSLQVRHPPACATTLIVSLGLLSGLIEGIVIIVAVALLVGVQTAIVLGPELTARLKTIVTNNF